MPINLRNLSRSMLRIPKSDSLSWHIEAFLFSEFYSTSQFFFYLMSFGAPGGRGPRFIEPHEPPVATPLHVSSLPSKVLSQQDAVTARLAMHDNMENGIGMTFILDIGLWNNYCIYIFVINYCKYILYTYKEFVITEIVILDIPSNYLGCQKLCKKAFYFWYPK